MRILIIEDEKSASLRLKKMLGEINNKIIVVGIEETIEDSITFLTNNPLPDLIFLDIQLSDGLSFEIFENIEITVPVIFTTAYDEYALKAFELNSIDYLLKPLNKKEVEHSLTKYEQLTKIKIPDWQSIFPSIYPKKQEYKSRFLVKTGASMEVISCDDIALFYIENQIVHPLLFNKLKKSLDNTLDEIEKTLNPKKFFRINRQMIINIRAISKINTYFNNRLLINLIIPYENDIIVSREKVSSFKNWVEQ